MSPSQKKAEAKKAAGKKDKDIEKTSAPAKAEKKSSKSAKMSAPEEAEEAPPAVDQDELEEAEDEAASAGSGGGGGNAAAIAAASGGTEMSASFKNFRHHPDMENFYRFIYENDLRHEALAIIDEIMLEKQTRKTAKTGKSAH